MVTFYKKELRYITNVENITLYKPYSIIDIIEMGWLLIDGKTENVTLYKIENDLGVVDSYNSKIFIKINEWREIQLNKLSI